MDERREMLVRATCTSLGPAMWEHGGGYPCFGYATIIASPTGKPLRFIATGNLSNREHALLLVRKGCLVICVYWWGSSGFSARIWKITGFTDDSEYARLKPVYELSSKEIDEFLKAKKGTPLASAVKAAMEKAKCLYCREPHYILKEVKKGSRLSPRKALVGAPLWQWDIEKLLCEISDDAVVEVTDYCATESGINYILFREKPGRRSFTGKEFKRSVMEILDNLKESASVTDKKLTIRYYFDEAENTFWLEVPSGVDENPDFVQVKIRQKGGEGK